MEDIYLVKPDLSHRAEVEAFKEELVNAADADYFAGCNSLGSYENYEEWLAHINIPTRTDGKVPSDTYIAIRCEDHKMVGIIDLRHNLNHPVLSAYSGHIGYSVRPSERAKGYARSMLALAVDKAFERGIELVMVSCREENVASERTILANGGTYEYTVDRDGIKYKRYWIRTVHSPYSSHVVDMTHDKRAGQFEYFSTLANPYMGLTVNVDITRWIKFIKENHLPFYNSFLYAVLNAANSVPELRRRIIDGKAVEFDICPASFTLGKEDETYCYCDVTPGLSYLEFIKDVERCKEIALAKSSLDDGDDGVAKYFFSSVPWLSYVSLVQPSPIPADSNPRIIWGKYYNEGDKTLIPVSIMCNHALVDGIHLAHFYRAIDSELLKMESEI